MQFVLDDQVRRAQRTVRDRPYGGKTAPCGVRARILKARGREPVARAIAIDLPEQHLRAAVPGHLRELVDGCDQEGRQTPVDFFVNRDHRNAVFRRPCPAEVALAESIAAVGQHARTALRIGLDPHMLADIDRAAAPRAVSELQRRADTAARPHAPPAKNRVMGLVDRVGRRLHPDPQAHPKRLAAPGGRVGAAHHLACADQRGGALELLKRQQAQGVTHDHRHAGMAHAAANHALQTAQGQRIGGQAKIGLGLAAAGGKPQQVGDGGCRIAALRVIKPRHPRQVDEHESELKRAPGAVLRDIPIAEHGCFAGAQRLAMQCMDALLPHRAVGEAERAHRLRIGVEQCDAGGDALAGFVARAHRIFGHRLVRRQLLGRVADAGALAHDPVAICGGQGLHRCQQIGIRHLGQKLHVEHHRRQGGNVFGGWWGGLRQFVGWHHTGDNSAPARRVCRVRLGMHRHPMPHGEFNLLAVQHFQRKLLHVRTGVELAAVAQ